MAVALLRTGGEPIRGFLMPQTPNGIEYGRPSVIGSPANQNIRPVRPGAPWGPRPGGFGYSPRVSPALLVYSQLRYRLEDWAAYEFSQLLRGITYISRPNIANSPGWHLAADCASGPGNFMGSFADPVYCGPLPSEPSPGGVLEDPTSYNIKWYKFHPELGVTGEWRFHELWSAVKWDGVTLYPPPEVVQDVMTAPLPDPWPWNIGWRAARTRVGWSFPLERTQTEDVTDSRPRPRTKVDNVTVRVLNAFKPGLRVAHHPRDWSRFDPVKRPGKKKKEVKLGLRGSLAGMAFDVANILSEGADFINALNQGLPKFLRLDAQWVHDDFGDWNWVKDASGKWFQDRGHYRAPTPLENAQNIYKNFGQMNWDRAVTALATNEVVDRLYGRVGRANAKASRKAGRPVGYQAGPWDNPVPGFHPPSQLPQRVVF